MALPRAAAPITHTVRPQLCELDTVAGQGRGYRHGCPMGHGFLLCATPTSTWKQPPPRPLSCPEPQHPWDWLHVHHDVCPA